MTTAAAAAQANTPWIGASLLIAEEGLRNYSGHWFEHTKAAVDANREAGAKVTVAVNAHAPAEMLADLRAVPAFRYTRWDNHYNYRWRALRLGSVLVHNLRLWRDIARITKKFGPFDCAFAPTVALHHIVGWYLAARLLPIKRVVLLFRNNIGVLRGEKVVHTKSARVFGWLIRRFAPLAAQGRAVLACDSAELSAEYQTLTGLSFPVFPTPRLASLPKLKPATASSAKSAAVTFACLGPPRTEKGIDLVLEAITRVRSHGHRHLRFVVQWDSEVIGDDGSPLPIPNALAGDPLIEFIRTSLDSAAYAETLANADCLLLPYRRRAYYARISGICLEAASAGVPMIYTRDTWLAGAVERYGVGIPVEDGDIAGLAAAIEAVANSLGSLKRTAAERAGRAAQFHSLHAFIDALWKAKNTAAW